MYLLVNFDSRLTFDLYYVISGVEAANNKVMKQRVLYKFSRELYNVSLTVRLTARSSTRIYLWS